MNQSDWLQQIIKDLPLTTQSIDIVSELSDKKVLAVEITKQFIHKLIRYFDKEVNKMPIDSVLIGRFANWIKTLSSELNTDFLEESVLISMKNLCIRHNSVPETRTLFKILNKTPDIS
ncbi:hypothetical protein HZS_3839 [Henneguya salminicola]|nr:hypothetical protein HZS_3839 [Henneguya salminicola]